MSPDPAVVEGNRTRGRHSCHKMAAWSGTLSSLDSLAWCRHSSALSIVWRILLHQLHLQNHMKWIPELFILMFHFKYPFKTFVLIFWTVVYPQLLTFGKVCSTISIRGRKDWFYYFFELTSPPPHPRSIHEIGGKFKLGLTSSNLIGCWNRRVRWWRWVRA